MHSIIRILSAKADDYHGPHNMRFVIIDILKPQQNGNARYGTYMELDQGDDQVAFTIPFSLSQS